MNPTVMGRVVLPSGDRIYLLPKRKWVLKSDSLDKSECSRISKMLNRSFTGRTFLPTVGRWWVYGLERLAKRSGGTAHDMIPGTKGEGYIYRKGDGPETFMTNEDAVAAVKEALADMKNSYKNSEDGGGEHSGVMISLMLPPGSHPSLLGRSSPGNAEDLHITLAYLGDSSSMTQDVLNTVRTVCRYAAQCGSPPSAKVGGVGVFPPSGGSESRYVVYCPVDSVDVENVRNVIVSTLKQIGVFFHHDHSFTPHVTLGYSEEPPVVDPVEEKIITFKNLSLSIGGVVENFPFVQY